MFGDSVDFILKNSDPFFLNEIVSDSYSEGLRLEKIFNFYDSKSELSILNQKRKLKVSKELLELIKLGTKYSKLSKGEYDITLGKSIQGRKTSGANLKFESSYKDIKIKGNLVELNSLDALIDLGSIAKGYIVDKMVEVLIHQGIESGLINGRGDIRVFGNQEQIIGIQDPRQKNKILKTIRLKNCSVATSGDYKQYVKSFENSHIVNNKDVISVTVIAKSLTEADLFATLLFVCDKTLREEILQKNKNIKTLIVNKDLNIKYYNHFEDYLLNEVDTK
jgi:thiamine biosynthesis lipoprotein